MKRVLAGLLAVLRAAGAPLRPIAPDAVFAAATALMLYWRSFRFWPLWEDQSIYEYMAWGVRHGQVLYRDAINMNWPGVVVMHLIGQVFGPAGPGLRLLECLAIGVLFVSTSLVLHAFRVNALVRMGVLILYLGAYVGLGYENTAQRESFLVAFMAVAMVPFGLSLADPKRAVSHGGWIAAGACAAMAVWSKPTAGLVLTAVPAVTVLFWLLRGELRGRVRPVLSWVLGACALTAAMLLFLAVCGSLRGFFHWAVAYAFGPYASIRYTPEVRWVHFANILRDGAGMPTLMSFVRISLGALGVSIIVALPIVVWKRRDLARVHARRLLAAVSFSATLAGTAIASIYLQGKTHSGYHFIPMMWAFTLGAGVLWTNSRICADGLRSRIASPMAAVAAFGLLLYQLNPHFKQPPPHDDSTMADSLRANLGPSESVVLFGFQPSILRKLERPTPFAFVDSWIMYACAGDTAFRREILADWNRALLDPQVRFFLVHRSLQLMTGGEISELIVAEHFPESRLAELGFARTGRIAGAGGYDVYERAR